MLNYITDTCLFLRFAINGLQITSMESLSGYCKQVHVLYVGKEHATLTVMGDGCISIAKLVR